MARGIPTCNAVIKLAEADDNFNVLMQYNFNMLNIFEKKAKGSLINAFGTIQKYIEAFYANAPFLFLNLGEQQDTDAANAHYKYIYAITYLACCIDIFLTKYRKERRSINGFTPIHADANLFDTTEITCCLENPYANAVKVKFNLSDVGVERFYRTYNIYDVLAELDCNVGIAVLPFKSIREQPVFSTLKFYNFNKDFKNELLKAIIEYINRNDL